MNVTVDDLVQEIGRLHIQIMSQQKLIADLQKAQIVEKTPEPSAQKE